MSCPQIWNIEQEKDREKEKVGGRPAKLNEKKGRDRGLEREIKNRGDIFLLEERRENFVAAVTKWEMLAATNARWKWAAVKKKVNKKTYDISSIKCVTKMFLAPVVQTLDSAIHRIKIYPVDNAIGSPNTYPLDSDLSSG